MKLHDLRPADGSRQPRTRVGRGIAAGKGKTAGRGTKGQKARAGGSIPPWFEGGQTPIHMRIPKLRGFKNRFKIDYEVVNIGAIAALAEAGAFEVEGGRKPTKSAPVTINQDILRAVGLVRTLNKPLKILGAGELSLPLFVVADAFTGSARSKIEAAGGSVNVLEMPASPLAALGVRPKPAEPATGTAAPRAKAKTDDAPADDAKSDAAPDDDARADDARAASTPELDTTAEPAARTPGKAATAKTPAAKASAAKASAGKGPAGKGSAAKGPAAKGPAAKARPGKAAPASAPVDGDASPAPAVEAEPPSGDDA
jgi:large subunit ribosomal protein L15